MVVQWSKWSKGLTKFCWICWFERSPGQYVSIMYIAGILLHYDDVNLQDIYFLDPQWLCDMLASVVTIREVNCLPKSGRHHYDIGYVCLTSCVKNKRQN